MDERLQFVARRLAGEPMAELCREFGISRKTGYKIFDRVCHDKVSIIETARYDA
jgi:transposase-like protein